MLTRLFVIVQHFLVLTSMKFDCYGDDKNIIDYTNKSLLIAPVSRCISSYCNYAFVGMFRVRVFTYQLMHGCISVRQHCVWLVSCTNVTSMLS